DELGPPPDLGQPNQRFAVRFGGDDLAAPGAQEPTGRFQHERIILDHDHELGFGIAASGLHFGTFGLPAASNIAAAGPEINRSEVSRTAHLGPDAEGALVLLWVE